MTVTGVFGEDGSITGANVKASNYTYEGDLVNGIPKGKGRLEWQKKVFKNLFAGFF